MIPPPHLFFFFLFFSSPYWPQTLIVPQTRQHLPIPLKSSPILVGSGPPFFAPPLINLFGPQNISHTYPIPIHIPMPPPSLKPCSARLRNGIPIFKGRRSIKVGNENKVPPPCMTSVLHPE
ncbi:hypothetical protein IE53DRAFT_262666 [Violaceomyces palustris]|uniref:Uncharacterized protein n=1 Tax=Violaceomyces palustris TaxID=1673888 RepID=A0ACD0NMZ4_9BASI|nr:hypothetical protein IE53DRAFT_262666 [Violaceomyces palustris]